MIFNTRLLIYLFSCFSYLPTSGLLTSGLLIHLLTSRLFTYLPTSALLTSGLLTSGLLIYLHLMQ